jgi:hypothetical protein
MIVKAKKKYMHLQVKAVFKTAKTKKDNTSTIAIQYCYTSEKRHYWIQGYQSLPNIGLKNRLHFGCLA